MERRAVPGWVDTALEIAEQSNPDGIAWAIERKDTGEVIGWFGISNPVDPANTYNVDFEYALARAHWNQGYMTEVLRGIFAYEFDTLGVPQLSANCCAANIGSARAMEKAGMRRTKSDYSADFEGNWCHRHHYRITRDDGIGTRRRFTRGSGIGWFRAGNPSARWT